MSNFKIQRYLIFIVHLYCFKLRVPQSNNFNILITGDYSADDNTLTKFVNFPNQNIPKTCPHTHIQLTTILPLSDLVPTDRKKEQVVNITFHLHVSKCKYLAFSPYCLFYILYLVYIVLFIMYILCTLLCTLLLFCTSGQMLNCTLLCQYLFSLLCAITIKLHLNLYEYNGTTTTHPKSIIIKPQYLNDTV